MSREVWQAILVWLVHLPLVLLLLPLFVAITAAIDFLVAPSATMSYESLQSVTLIALACTPLWVPQVLAFLSLRIWFPEKRYSVLLLLPSMLMATGLAVGLIY